MFDEHDLYAQIKFDFTHFCEIGNRQVRIMHSYIVVVEHIPIVLRIPSVAFEISSG